MANELRYRATIKDDVSGPLERIKDKFGQLRAAGAKPLLQGLAIGAGIAAFNALGQAVSAATGWLGDSVGAAREEEVGIARLTQAIRANVDGWNGNTAAIEDVIEAREKLAFSDGEQRESLAKLVAVTKDVDKALELQATAMDFARLRGIDLATAGDLLGKVYAGNVGILGRYGVQLQKGTSSTEALAKVQEMAAGQAEAFANTTEGAAQSAGIALENLQEDIGEGLMPVVRDLSLWARDDGVPALRDFVSALKFLGSAFGEASQETENFREQAEEMGIFWKLTGMEIEGGMERIDGSSREAADALIDFRASERQSANAAQGLTGAAGELGESLDDTGDAAGDAASELKKMERAAENALDAFLEATLGPKALKLELKQAKDELRENTREAEKTRAKIDRMREAGKPVGELKDDLRDLRMEIIDNKEDAIRATARLEDMGEVPMGATEKAVRGLIGPLDAVGDEAWQAYEALRAMARLGGVATGGGGGGGGKKRARGGPVEGGNTYRVGEEGEESLIMFPGGGGMVIPGGGGSLPSGRGGGHTSLTINVNTPALTPGGAQALADAIAPAITRWQQRSGLI